MIYVILKLIQLFLHKMLYLIKFFIHELKCFIIIIICFLLKPFLSRFFKSKTIWIIGENSGETLQDNGYCFFKYCYKAKVCQEVFFLTKTKYIFNDVFLRSNKNLLIYGTIKHIVYLFFADVLIFSQTHRDILYDPLFSIFSKDKKIVNLKHGVFGLKKAIAYVHSHRNEPDLITVVSEYEKSIFTNFLKTEEKRLKITGLARFDYLSDISRDKSGIQIFFMPTWRDWIKIENFFFSDFYNNISKLIADNTLNAFLKNNNIILKVYLHKIMQKYVSIFDNKSNQIKFIEFGQESIQQLLNESHLLITDYSSVSWDFFYLNKPIIFYQFDLNDYMYYRGSYLDLQKEIFGDCAYTIESLVKLIKFYYSNNFTERERFKKKKILFKYTDDSNCKRIYEEILKLTSNLKK